MPEIMTQCQNCLQRSLIKISTYKRNWFLCNQCGTATPKNKKTYAFSFLPFDDLKKNFDLNESTIYDYFITESNIKVALEDQIYFHNRYILPSGVDFRNKKVLDISGGNGHFINQYKELTTEIDFTEINDKALDYVKQTHKFSGVYKYNINSDNLFQVTKKKYDIILARACIMFSKNIDLFSEQIKQVLNPGGLVVVDRSIEPTLGVLLRVQLDQYSYYFLRQPTTVIQSFENAGFKLAERYDEIDPTLYNYDHDLLLHWFFIHYFYEIPAAYKLRAKRFFNFPARDRRMSTFIFKL